MKIIKGNKYLLKYNVTKRKKLLFYLGVIFVLSALASLILGLLTNVWGVSWTEGFMIFGLSLVVGVLGIALISKNLEVSSDKQL